MIILAAAHQAGLLINTRPWWLPPTALPPGRLSGRGDGVVPRGACGCNQHMHTQAHSSELHSATSSSLAHNPIWMFVFLYTHTEGVAPGHHHLKNFKTKEPLVPTTTTIRWWKWTFLVVRPLKALSLWSHSLYSDAHWWWGLPPTLHHQRYGHREQFRVKYITQGLVRRGSWELNDSSCISGCSTHSTSWATPWQKT